MTNCKTSIVRLAACLLLAGTGSVFAGAAAGGKTEAPEAVRKAIASAYPDAKVTSITPEKEEIDQFEVVLTEHGKKIEVDVAPDGTLIGSEEVVEETDVPAPAREAIKKAAEGATIKAYEKATKMADVNKEKNTATKLDKPVITYEGGLTKGDMRAEVAVTPEGKVVEEPKWKKIEKEDKEDKDGKK